MSPHLVAMAIALVAINMLPNVGMLKIIMGVLFILVSVPLCFTHQPVTHVTRNVE